MMKNCPFICVFVFQQKPKLGLLSAALLEGARARTACGRERGRSCAGKASAAVTRGYVVLVYVKPDHP